MCMVFEELIKHQFDSERRKAIAHLMFTAKLLMSKITEALAPHDLTFQQFNILAIIEGQKSGAANVNIIKERMFDRNSNVSRLLNKMVSKGWIEKHRCTEDQRVVYLKITKTGKNMRKIGQEIISKLFQEFSVLNEDEYLALNQTLDKFDQIYF